MGTLGSHSHYRCRNCGAEESHPCPDPDRLVDIVHQDGVTGVCLACGGEQSGVEPDARDRQCDACGRDWVAGAEHILTMMLHS